MTESFQEERKCLRKAIGIAQFSKFRSDLLG